MIKKPMKQLFKNYEKIAKKLNIDLNLRPQNISKNKYLEICKIYEKLNLIIFYMIFNKIFIKKFNFFFFLIIFHNFFITFFLNHHLLQHNHILSILINLF